MSVETTAVMETFGLLALFRIKKATALAQYRQLLHVSATHVHSCFVDQTVMPCRKPFQCNLHAFGLEHCHSSGFNHVN